MRWSRWLDLASGACRCGCVSGVRRAGGGGVRVRGGAEDRGGVAVVHERRMRPDAAECQRKPPTGIAAKNASRGRAVPYAPSRAPRRRAPVARPRGRRPGAARKRPGAGGTPSALRYVPCAECTCGGKPPGPAPDRPTSLRPGTRRAARWPGTRQPPLPALRCPALLCPALPCAALLCPPALVCSAAEESVNRQQSGHARPRPADGPVPGALATRRIPIFPLRPEQDRSGIAYRGQWFSRGKDAP